MIDNLVRKAKKGNKEAFNQLIILFQNDLYKIAKVKLNNEEDICDVVQETFISAYKNINKLKNIKKFKSWLITILINNCNNFFRKSKDNTVSLEDKNIDRYLGKEDENNSSINFFELIKELNIDERTIIILYYSEGYRIKEISKILNINYDTTKCKLKRARKKLEEKINEENSLWKN